MPENHEVNQLPEKTPNDFEQSETAKASRELGAKILSIVRFESGRNKDIVESSFDKARGKEKLPNGNGLLRRNYSYLGRLEKLVDKFGNNAEKHLWQQSIKEDLLIKYENIPDSYWEAKQQELRDSGQGNIDFNELYKNDLFKSERKLQEESLQKWANYLGDEHSPYPLWFKVYAWDGMTKMGVYNKKKAQYEARNKTTVAPFPDPDPEILSGVFDVVNRYFGNNEKEFYTEEGERNIELEQITSSGNFAKIFNAIQRDVSPIVTPPENTVDVRGEWVEYLPGDEKDVARAAKGTGWCVASSAVGRHYLEYGTYSREDNHGKKVEESKAKFILFHLRDSENDKLSKNACASVRLNTDGRVAEVSGLKEGQALDDSLVPIVEAKVKSLPGGEEFLESFADKKRLIALDRKMGKEQDLSKEELEFLYEMNRPIKTLDTYNDSDPRIDELKTKYNIEYTLNAGIDADQLLTKLDKDSVANNLDTLLAHGADAEQIVSQIGLDCAAEKIDSFINHGADTVIDQQLASRLNSKSIINNLAFLTDHGIDVNQIAWRIAPGDAAGNLDTLLSHGINVDINNLVSRLSQDEIVKNIDNLNNHGANIDINQLLSKMRPDKIIAHLDTLLDHGANIDINQLLSKMAPHKVIEHLDTLLGHGASIDVEQYASQLESDKVVENLDVLLSHGMNTNQLVSRFSPDEVAFYLDKLIDHGANIDIEQLVSQLTAEDIVWDLDTLISNGANIDIDKLVSELDIDQMSEDMKDKLRRHGANI